MPSTPSLSEGALLQICQGGRVEAPLIQVLGFKKIAGNSADRYRVFISDGKYSNSFSMLATQLNEMVVSGQMENFAVVKVNKYICNTMQNKKVIILLELDVVAPGSEVGRKLGDPVQINADGTLNKGAEKRPAEDSSNGPEAKRSPLTSSENRSGGGGVAAPAPRGILSPRPPALGASTDPSTLNVFPIASLTPYQNKWTIKVRVTNKSDIRRWSNSRGEGHLFSMDLLDESGEIRATAFKEQCDKFYHMIEVGKLYYITSCTLKAANKQFSNLNNEYEMTFRDSTEVLPCNEDSSKIPTLSFSFVKIADLDSAAKESLVDIIGICKSASDATTITSSRTQKEFTKRDLVLVDQSLAEVGLTLWGTTAETFDPTDNPVVAIKGVKVSDFNGVSLSAVHSSVVQINPDLPQAHTLKGWYDTDGSTAQTYQLTQSGSGRGGDSGVGSIIQSVGEIKLDSQGKDFMGKAEFVSAFGYITMFQKEKALYQACGREVDGKTCNKKVLDQNNGFYRCEKCNTEIDNFTWRMILQCSVTDMNGQVWVTCFQEQAETILGVQAQELGALFTQDSEQYNSVFAKATFRRFHFRLSMKNEMYNDESRVRYIVRSVTPLTDCTEYSKRLAKDLKEAGEQVPDRFNK